MPHDDPDALIRRTEAIKNLMGDVAHERVAARARRSDISKTSPDRPE